MAQLNITVNTDILHGLFTSNGRDEAFSMLLNQYLGTLETVHFERSEGQKDQRVRLWIVGF